LAGGLGTLGRLPRTRCSRAEGRIWAGTGLSSGGACDAKDLGDEDRRRSQKKKRANFARGKRAAQKRATEMEVSVCLAIQELSQELIDKNKQRRRLRIV